MQGFFPVVTLTATPGFEPRTTVMLVMAESQPKAEMAVISLVAQASNTEVQQTIDFAVDTK